MDPLSFLSTKIVISPEKELSLYKTFNLTATQKRGNGRASRAFTGFRFQVWFDIWEFEFEISAGLPAVVCCLWSAVCSQLVDFLS